MHEGGYHVDMLEGQPRFTRPDGRPVMPPVTPPQEPLRLDDAAIAKDRMTLVSRWDGSRIHYGDVVSTLV